jgi:hypothetical protein
MIVYNHVTRRSWDSRHEGTTSFFGAAGIDPELLLEDAPEVARLPRDPVAQGPHVVTGPVAVDGARPGDVLEVEVLELGSELLIE